MIRCAIVNFCTHPFVSVPRRPYRTTGVLLAFRALPTSDRFTNMTITWRIPVSGNKPEVAIIPGRLPESAIVIPEGQVSVLRAKRMEFYGKKLTFTAHPFTHVLEIMSSHRIPNGRRFHFVGMHPFRTSLFRQHSQSKMSWELGHMEYPREPSTSTCHRLMHDA